MQVESIAECSPLLLNAGQKYCRMLHGEHSAILSTFIKLPFVFKILFCLFLSGHFRQVLLYNDYLFLKKSNYCHEHDFYFMDLNATTHKIYSLVLYNAMLEVHMNGLCNKCA